MLLCISNSFFVLIFHAQACTLVKTFNKLKCFVWPVYWCECRFFCGRSTLCKHRHVLCFSNVLKGSCSWPSCGSILYRAVIGHPWKCIGSLMVFHMPQITYRCIRFICIRFCIDLWHWTCVQRHFGGQFFRIQTVELLLELCHCAWPLMVLHYL